MDGLCRAIGASALVEFGGSEYLLAPLTLGDLGVVENFMVLGRVLPTDSVRPLVAAAGSDAVKDKLLAIARKEMKAKPQLRIARTDQIDKFIYTAAGIHMTLWLCLRKEHPLEFPTRRAVQEKVEAAVKSGDEMAVANLVRARDAISGLGLLNELDWRQDEDLVRPEVLKRRRERAALVYRPMPWRSNFRVWAEEAGIPLSEFRNLTLYQYRSLMVDRKELGITSIKAKRRARPPASKPVVISNDGAWREQLNVDADKPAGG